MTQRILVTCVGNICRSPTAELLFRHYAPGVAVSSAGISALGGEPMAATALDVLRAHGLDGSRHIARQLHGALLDDADLILVMEKVHADAIARNAPLATGRLFLLDHWQDRHDIADPFGQPRSAFEDAYLQIDRAVQAWLPHLQTD